MARPLQFINRPGIGIDFQEMSSAQLARLRYNLRVRYANQLNAGGAGAIIVGGGTNFGSASNTERTRNSSVHPNSIQVVNTGTLTRNSYSYGLNLSGIPSFPTDFTNSYAFFNNNDFQQAGSATNFLDGIITETINEMRTGDEVGTYRVSTSSPGTGWVSRGLFFRDSYYNNATIANYNLYLRTSATVPAASTVFPVRITSTGDFQEHNVTTMAALENLLYTILVTRLGAGSLRYDIDGTAGVARGTFIDTRRASTNRDGTGQFGADDYRSVATPSGGTTNFRTYTLRIL